MAFRSIEFIDAKTDDQQLAIQTCPGFDEVSKYVMGAHYYPATILYYCQALRVLDERERRSWMDQDLQLTYCPVKVCSNGNKLRISGRCLME